MSKLELDEETEELARHAVLEAMELVGRWLATMEDVSRPASILIGAAMLHHSASCLLEQMDVDRETIVALTAIAVNASEKAVERTPHYKEFLAMVQGLTDDDERN